MHKLISEIKSEMDVYTWSSTGPDFILNIPPDEEHILTVKEILRDSEYSLGFKIKMQEQPDEIGEKEFYRISIVKSDS